MYKVTELSLNMLIASMSYYKSPGSYRQGIHPPHQQQKSQSETEKSREKNKKVINSPKLPLYSLQIGQN